MELRNKLFAGLAFFSLLLAGCNSDGSSSGEGSNPPVSEETYTITWKNYDGGVLETDTNVAYGSTPTYDGATPTKGGTAQYTYTFTGWSPEVTTVTGDKTYTAQFSDSVNSYTIIWKNWDGSVLETDANVAYGSTPSYDGTTPTRANADGFSYTFSGWSPSLSVVRNDATYTAAYSQIKIGVNLTITYSLYNPKTNRLIETYTNEPTEMGNVSVSGTYDFNTYVDLFADPNEGYTFDGWYYEGLILSSDHNYKYMMWDQDITLEARFKYTTYSLHIFANHNENGLIMIKFGHYNTYVSEDTTNQYYTESVTIAAYSKNDTRFLGWYDKDNNLISTNAVYTFNMSNSNIDIEAKWNYFTITYNLNGGTQNDSNPTSYNIDSGNLSLANPTKTGYTFMGWQYNGENVVSINPNWAKDVTLNALWNDGNEYVVALDTDGGEVSQASVDVRYGHPYSLPVPTKLGYTFEGWYDGSLEIGNSGTWKYTSNKSLAAKWSIITYSITYNLNGGTNAISNPTSYTVEDTISLANPSKNFNTFVGWYLNDKKIETIVLGTTGDLTIETKWSQTDEQKAEEEQEELRRLGGIPTLSDDGKTITYGLYPQKNVNDSTLVSALNTLTTPESNGWYLYEGDYYAKVIATPCDDNDSFRKFDNGTTIVSGTTYWFKCEPIVWNVLSNNNGEYYIVSSVLLDAHCYYNSDSNRTIDGKTVYPNNYMYSDIREWLNNDFYNSAFALGNSYIQTTTVDNSAATTSSTSNGYACASTEDKVFLPSYKDYFNNSYGFSTSSDSAETRCCRTTDWARARGSYYYTSNGSYQYNECNGNGYYWTRSPLSDGSDFAWLVGFHGYLDGGGSVYGADISVRPGLSIKIAQFTEQ